jgi:hypothetical protein
LPVDGDRAQLIEVFWQVPASTSRGVVNVVEAAASALWSRSPGSPEQYVSAFAPEPPPYLPSSILNCFSAKVRLPAAVGVNWVDVENGPRKPNAPVAATG